MIKMNDGRFLMAREKDILAFFAQNDIVGRTITGIYPEYMDYGISNWDELIEEIDDISLCTNECAIQTDGSIFLELDYGDCLEIQFSGSGGPVILNVIPKIKLAKQPYHKTPTDVFSLNTLFHECRGKTISAVIADKHDGRMWFPRFHGIDMSTEDEGVYQIRLILEDESYLAFSGSVDWSCVDYLDEQGENKIVPMSWLLPNCLRAMAVAMDEEAEGTMCAQS